MSAALYYLALPVLYVISYLPFRVLYLLSDVLYLLIYKVIGYRVKVVTKNLRNSFPEKSDTEIDKIREGFYRYFCDLTLETIKTLSISPAALNRHFKKGNFSEAEDYYKNNQSVIIVMGHLGNWELGASYFTQIPLHKAYLIYHPLTNTHFDKLFIRMRTRLGNGVYPMKSAFKGMVKNKNKVTATAFIADQTPTPANAHWMTFLNQDTAVFRGAAVISKKLDYPILYVSIIRESRGQYLFNTELLVDQPQQFSEDEITELHTRRLEQDIIEYPETWLWSHRRWKHKRPEGNQLND